MEGASEEYTNYTVDFPWRSVEIPHYPYNHDHRPTTPTYTTTAAAHSLPTRSRHRTTSHHYHRITNDHPDDDYYLAV
jgi:hypothetical protein